MSQPIRIAVLHFQHETVTFLRNDTTIDDFVYPGSPARGEALLASGPKSYMGGFVQVAREFDGVALVGIESPLWPKTGTGSGWLTQEAFETYVGRMIAQLTAEGPFDGVYLCVHGAMAARGIPRPEAELARRVRTVVGPRAFIAATFDPHGNEDEEFLRHADLAFCGKYFPHYDSHLQGQRAARMLIRAIKGQYQPTHATKKVPIISPTVVQWTGASPWMDLVQRALTWEAREPDVYVNVYFGFPWSDVPDAGMTIQVLTHHDAALAQHVADDMAGFAWRQRDRLLHSTQVHTIPEGVALARQAVAGGDTPVILADHSDRSGYATWLLQEIVEQGLSNTLIATVADADAIKALHGVKPGDAFDMAVGGLVDAVRRCKGSHRRHGAPRDRSSRPAVGGHRIRQRQRAGAQSIPCADHGVDRTDRGRPRSGSVPGHCDQVTCAFPAWFRRQRVRQDNPSGGADGTVPWHGAAGRVGLSECRSDALLSVRQPGILSSLGRQAG